MKVDNPLKGIQFNDMSGVQHLKVINTTDADLDVSIALIESQAVPANFNLPDVKGTPTVFLRGEFNFGTLTHNNIPLGTSPTSMTLKAGEVRDLVLGLDSRNLNGGAGDLNAGILRLTDTQGFTQIDVPVSVLKPDLGGLWIGDAVINEVRHDLKFFEQTDQTGSQGKTQVGSNTEFGGVPEPYPMRLLLHAGAGGADCKLLQRIYYGIRGQTQTALVSREELLDADTLSMARRVTSAHFPWTENNTVWACNGILGTDPNLTVTVTTDYNDQASNPFLHTYHPDHDNLNADYDSELPIGLESYQIRRDITLALTDPVTTDFDALASTHIHLTGTYQEKITLKGDGLNEKSYEVRGHFSLRHVSSISELITHD